MSSKGEKIDAKEVLKYLNQLGFRDITADQLKEFITDLKKLIKYEERLKKPGDSSVDLRQFCIPSDLYKSLSRSNARKSPKGHKDKGKKICIQMEEDGEEEVSAPTLTPCARLVPCGGDEPKADSPKKVKKKCVKEVDSDYECTCSVGSLASDTTCRIRHTEFPKYTKGVIHRIMIPHPPLQKTDPVNLYHKYERGWRYYRIPGVTYTKQDKSMMWSIRAALARAPRESHSTLSGYKMPSSSSSSRHRL